LPVAVASLRPEVVDNKKTVVLNGEAYMDLRDLFRARMERRREPEEAEPVVGRRKPFVSMVDGLDLDRYLVLDEKGTTWLEYNKFCDTMDRTHDRGAAENLASDDALRRLIEGW